MITSSYNPSKPLLLTPVKNCKTLRCYSAPRDSSQGSSSLPPLACSALGAVVQNGRGSSAFFFPFFVSSLDVVSFSSVMIFTTSSQAAPESQQKAMVLVTAYSDFVKVFPSEVPIDQVSQESCDICLPLHPTTT